MPFLVFASALLLIAVGLGAYQQLDIEAYPNPCPPLVEVLTQPPGWSAEETSATSPYLSRSGFRACPVWTIFEVFRCSVSVT